MSRKIMLVALIISLVAALISGGTMAWFTAKAAAPVNEFTAGTVMIEAGTESVYGDASMTNVNPGDAFKKCIPIENTGSKAIRLSMTGEFDFDIDWNWIGNNWEELCFSLQAWEDADELEDAIVAALENGNVTNPADAVGEPNGPFDGAGNLVIPVMVAPTETGDWFMKYVDGQKVFFYDGILEAGEDTTLCVIVVFDGPWMGNFWQGATFTLEGTFQAVQASNEAPENVWGMATWDNYETVSGLPTKRDQLAADFSEAYVNYFYENGDFSYAYLCEMNGDNGDDDNGNGNGWFYPDETAFGGDSEGSGSAWWLYFDMTGEPTQTITAGQHYDAGEVTITVIENGNGEATIYIGLAAGWDLQDDPEAVKVGGYDEIPATRPAGGDLNLYKGTLTTINVPIYDYYVIHLDLQYESDEEPITKP